MTKSPLIPAPRSALQRALLIAAALLVLWSATIWLVDPAPLATLQNWLPDYYYLKQDRAWLPLAGLTFAALAVLLDRAQTKSEIGLRLSWPAVLAIAVCVFVVAAVGARVVFDRFPVSRDEILAGYDAQILQSGRLVAPVAQEWREFLEALAPRFMTPAADNAATVSAYLPINALIRAIVGSVVDPSFTGPLLAAASVLLCFGIGRKLWPQRPEAAAIAALIVALSPQVLTNAMTAYAMSAHLALNLLWLSLYLRGDKKGHAGAIAVGFAAAGLHQFAFHLLFVAPFILRARLRGQWRLTGLYVVAYTAILAFWVLYFRLALQVSGFDEQSAIGAGPLFVLQKIATPIVSRDGIGALLMLKNLARFFAWQTPLLLPLLILAWRDLREDTGIVRELAGGAVLTALFCFVIIPGQGHGWGYRYLHGLIGSLALVAGYGWLRVAKDASRSLPLLGLATAAGVAWFGVQLKFAHDFAAPYRIAEAAIRAAPADFVLVDSQGMFFAEDLVRNDPFLRNRPLVMSASLLTPAQVEALCAIGKVQLFDRTTRAAAGIIHFNENESFARVATAPCVTPLSGNPDR